MSSEINDILNQEIVRELLLEKDPNLPDVVFNSVWQLCKKNPWDAPIIYEMLKIAGKDMQ